MGNIRMGFGALSGEVLLLIREDELYSTVLHSCLQAPDKGESYIYHIFAKLLLTPAAFEL